MATVRGLFGLLREAWPELARGAQVQVAATSESLAQLFVVSCMAAQGGAQPPTWLDKVPAPARLWRPRKIVVVVPSPKELAPWLTFAETAAAAFAEQGLWTTALLPYIATWGNDRFINPALARRQRLHALAALAQRESGALVVTTASALAQKTLAPVLMQRLAVRLVAGSEHDQDSLVAQFEDLGYTRAAVVEEEGTYAVRGGILDVFPPSLSHPVRLELIGDTLESIRSFLATDQKSRTEMAQLVLGPAHEAVTTAATRKDDVQRLYDALIAQNIAPADRDGMLKAFQLGVRFAGLDMLAPLFRPEEAFSCDYLDADTVLFFPMGLEPCLNRHADFVDAAAAHSVADLSQRRICLAPERHFATAAELGALLGAEKCRPLVEFGNPHADPARLFIRVDGRVSLEGAPATTASGADLFDKWASLARDVHERRDGAVAILATTDEQRERIKSLMAHRELTLVETPQLLARLGQGHIEAGALLLGFGDLSHHAWLDDANVLVLPEHSIFGVRARRSKPASAKLQNYLSSFAELKVGDLVVHVLHGIGRYQGMVSLPVAEVASDFLMIEYAGGDKVYLPVDRLNLLQRYSAGGEGASHQHALDKLGGPGWDKRKGKVKSAIREMADELLKIHARRAVARGHAFGPGDDSYLQFEAAFPYQETDDQLRVIDEVSADLQSGKPMDRLVCGDVGFGKTEIALRATMRAVLEGFQTLVLVPTTVLCYQHYRTFKDRLERHGVKVAQVNRFVRGAELSQAVAGLENGRVDVLIGTHRLLSADIKPKRLGLLIVDEEQRFGVVHKEKLKRLRAAAHVMTLSATPIPRTLHMAMVGLRDISIIATPPSDRLATKTYVARFDEQLIKDAILQEVRRGGQVFYVHNRVEDIEELRTWLATLLPGIAIRVGHGQMKEHELEKVIVDFLDQKFHVLLCTTIIESGIDMPNVNTLIVDRADRFGLAQLYQIKGRVGRSNVQAYAYFLTPAAERLTDEARERLTVLSAYQELGAGFQIASHDLELRGAGDLLGGEQSGHAAAVGLELYTEMLETAIRELRGEEVDETVDTELKLPLSAYIPKDYIASENQRLALYKSLFAAEDDEALHGLRTEIVDRFGKLPAELALLFRLARLKQLLRQMACSRLGGGKDAFELRFVALKEAQVAMLVEAVKRHPQVYRLTPDYKLWISAPVPTAQMPAVDQETCLAKLISLILPLLT